MTEGITMANGEPTVEGLILEQVRANGKYVKEVDTKVGNVFKKLGTHGELLARHEEKLDNIQKDQAATSGIIETLTEMIGDVEEKQDNCPARMANDTTKLRLDSLEKGRQSIAPKLPLDLAFKIAKWAVPILITGGAVAAGMWGWTP